MIRPWDFWEENYSGKILFLSHCVKGTYYPHVLSLPMLTLITIWQFLHYKVFPFWTEFIVEHLYTLPTPRSYVPLPWGWSVYIFYMEIFCHMPSFQRNKMKWKCILFRKWASSVSSRIKLNIGSNSKISACNIEDLGSIPRSGRLCRRKCLPTPGFIK